MEYIPTSENKITLREIYELIYETIEEEYSLSHIRHIAALARSLSIPEQYRYKIPLLFQSELIRAIETILKSPLEIDKYKAVVSALVTLKKLSDGNRSIFTES